MKRAIIFTVFVAALAAAVAAQRQPPDPRSAGGGNCASNPYNCIDAPTTRTTALTPRIPCPRPRPCGSKR